MGQAGLGMPFKAFWYFVLNYQKAVLPIESDGEAGRTC